MRIALVSVLSLVLGAMLWAFSPQLIGEIEPWDAPGNYYLKMLFGIGVLSSLVAGPRLKWLFWLWPIGTAIGQMLYGLTHLQSNPIILAGLLFLFIYSFATLVGSAIPAAVFLVYGYFFRSK